MAARIVSITYSTLRERRFKVYASNGYNLSLIVKDTESHKTYDIECDSAVELNRLSAMNDSEWIVWISRSRMDDSK
jgi:hypothetical protein